MERYSFRAQQFHEARGTTVLDGIVVTPDDRSFGARPRTPPIVMNKLHPERQRDQNSSPDTVISHPSTLVDVYPYQSSPFTRPITEETVRPERERRTSSRAASKAFRSRKPPLHGSVGNRASTLTESISTYHSKATFNPTVVMDDDGAEIMLDSCHMESDGSDDLLTFKDKMQTPIKSQRRLSDRTNLPLRRKPVRDSIHNVWPAIAPTNSLLDDDMSPSPSNATKPLRSFGAKLCCISGGDESLPLDEMISKDLVLTPQRDAERIISLFLSDPIGLNAWCYGWQAWSHVQNDEVEEVATANSKDDVKRVLRNRAFDMHARNRRIRKLKENLCPFDVTPQKVRRPVVTLSKTRSLSKSISQRDTSNLLASSSSSPPPSDSSHASDSMGFGSWDSVQLCGKPEFDSPLFDRVRTDEEDRCYDSDPEEITRRRSVPKVEENLQSSTTEDAIPPKGRKSDSLTRRLNFDFCDDDFIKTTVQEFMNDRFTLVWHPSVDLESSCRGTPLAVKAWIERGQQLNRSLIHPKLVWYSECQSEGDKCGINRTSPLLHSVDLLDIVRVLEVNRIDRKRYPLAKVRNCLLLDCLEATMMFEASCETERDRLVTGFKLLVARLGSKIMVHDDDVFDEFYTSFQTPK